MAVEMPRDVPSPNECIGGPLDGQFVQRFPKEQIGTRYYPPFFKADYRFYELHLIGPNYFWQWIG